MAAAGGAMALGIARPDAKQERYDRGMRLWGADGQKALEDAHICLLSATGAGSETMKNLVLPGVGRITVVDGCCVQWSDLGRNFFVTEASLGKNRAETVSELLLEMNPENVRCGAIPVSPQRLMEDRPDFFEQERVHCVVAADLAEDLLQQVAVKCEAAGSALVSVRAYGMIGVLRLWGGEHCVVEGFPDNEVEDLRVLNPFPSLQRYFEECGDPNLVADSMAHAHIPWPALASWYTRQWQARTGGGLPMKYPERKAIKELLMNGRMKKKVEEQTEEERAAGIPPGFREEQNYEEAANALNKYLPPKVPDKVTDLLKHPKAATVTRDSSIFWVLVHSLAAFHAEHGVMPVTGRVPDMTATTKAYVALKQVYLEKAAQDARWIAEHAARAMKAAGRDPGDMTEAVVMRFCKNCFNLRAIDYKSVSQELTGGNDDMTREVGASACDAWWYAVWRAAERFRAVHSRYPGDFGDDLEASLDGDVDELDKLLKATLKENGCAAVIPRDYAKEWCRFGHAELHTIASIIGGIAAQEVIKLVTRQRVPVNNTLIFNGIANTSTVLRL